MPEIAEQNIEQIDEQLLSVEQEQEMVTIVLNQIEAYHALDNIAETLEQQEIDEIAIKVIDGYNLDLDSRAEWEKSNESVMELAKLTVKTKTYAGDPVANTKYPIITNAAIQFAARAYAEIIKGEDVVKAKIVGDDPDGQKAARGERVATHLSYQLLNEMTDWEAGVDQMLFTLPVLGCAFKKTYRSGVENRNVSELVMPADLVVNYNAESLKKASRVTHIIELTKNEIIERIRTGVFLDFDVDELGQGGESEDNIDEDTPHKFLEQHRWYDLDDDGYQEPYIVTVHYATQKLVRISARYELQGVVRNDKKEIVRIEPVHYFTRFLFMPSPDAGFYGMGFGTLLQSINSSANTILNQLLDAGTINNRQSGFLGRGVQLGRGQSLKIHPGEWKPVQATGDDLRKNIVPLPTKQPSTVLFQLFGVLVDAGKELAGITEVLSGQSPGSNVPAETTLALIEQGLQGYSAVHKRIHRSLYEEFQKIRRLNILYLTQEEYSNVIDEQADNNADYTATDHDIIPVSDPNATTNMQRIMKAKALLSLKGQGLNDDEITRRYLQALQIDDIEALIPEEQQPNPIMELEIQAKQTEIQTSVAEQQKIAADTQLIVEKINTEKVNQEVKLLGTEFDKKKLELEQAQTINEIKITQESNRRETAKLINDIKAPAKQNDSKFEGKTAQTNTQGPYRESGMVSNNIKEPE